MCECRPTLIVAVNFNTWTIWFWTRMLMVHVPVRNNLVARFGRRISCSSTVTTWVNHFRLLQPITYHLRAERPSRFSIFQHINWWWSNWVSEAARPYRWVFFVWSVSLEVQETWLTAEHGSILMLIGFNNSTLSVHANKPLMSKPSQIKHRSTKTPL